jgi:asparagine synthase (glutamine-hydrolysing)
MCGIGAVLNPSGETSDAALSAMVTALRHRGPDGEGIRRMGPVALVHTRLAIIDVAGGHQPLESEDGRCVAIVNGEIYNHRALRAELEAEGHRFASKSDSEVVVHAYEEWGLDSVRRLNGIFAFALWDDRRQRLVAARDLFGVKPLYWSENGRRVVVASEVGALLASGLVSRGLDQIALDHFLTWRFVPAPRTMFVGIRKLPPASVLVSSDGRISLSNYREPPGPRLTAASVGELTAALSKGFREAVVRQMMSDVPYGAFLSGGIDSTAIVAAMKDGGNGAPRTFTIGFPGAGDVFDERGAAESSASLLGTRHRSTAMQEGDFLTEIARSIRRLEEPCGSPSAPAALQLSRFAAREVKVVLSGQGADEPLGGYQRHQAAAALGLADAVPGPVASRLWAAAYALPRNERLKRAANLLAAPPGLPRLLKIFEVTTPHVRAELRRAPMREADDERTQMASAVLSEIGDRADPLEQMLYLDTHLFLPDSLLLYGDKMSMAASLEQRVPFLDVEFMRFVERVPARLRVHHLRRKWLYRRALDGFVPPAVLQRRKHAFSTPYDAWLRSSLGTTVERIYRANRELAALIDVNAVSRLVGEHRTGRADHKRVLYCLLEFASWHEAFIEGRAESEARLAPA